MKKIKTVIVGFVFILLGVLGLIHHFIITGRFFDLGDMLHHEFFEAIALTAGIVLLATVILDKIAAQ